MSGFDEGEIFYSDVFGSEDQLDQNQLTRTATQKKFKKFIREFHEGTFVYPYRDQLVRNYNLGDYTLEIDLQDLRNYDEQLCDKLVKQPSEYLPLFEEAAKEAADESTQPRPEGEEEVQDIQVTLKCDANPEGIRYLKSDHVSKLVKVSGIIISASAIRAKATRITLQCRACRNTMPNVALRPGLEGYTMPRKCPTEQVGRPPCPLDPFFIIPDKCKCVDFQVLKLQELPDAVPKGEMPRHMQLYCDRYLTEKVVPGNRVTIMGIYSIKKSGKLNKKDNRENVGVGLRRPYLRVVGIQVDTDGPGRSGSKALTNDEEEEFRRVAARPDVYDVIARSIAPSIYGSENIKKAIACLLFGGSRKR